MSDDTISALGKDIETAIRARGRALAEVAGHGRGSDLIIKMFDDAADVAVLRTQLARIRAMNPTMETR